MQLQLQKRNKQIQQRLKNTSFNKVLIFKSNIWKYKKVGGENDWKLITFFVRPSRAFYFPISTRASSDCVKHTKVINRKLLMTTKNRFSLIHTTLTHRKWSKEELIVIPTENRKPFHATLRNSGISTSYALYYTQSNITQ